MWRRPEPGSGVTYTVTVNGGDWPSPDIRLDAVVDFIAHTREDVPRLLSEVRMLRRDAD
jgi:hypothetical protein